MNNCFFKNDFGCLNGKIVWKSQNEIKEKLRTLQVNARCENKYENAFWLLRFFYVKC